MYKWNALSLLNQRNLEGADKAQSIFISVHAKYSHSVTTNFPAVITERLISRAPQTTLPRLPENIKQNKKKLCALETIAQDPT